MIVIQLNSKVNISFILLLTRLLVVVKLSGASKIWEPFLSHNESIHLSGQFHSFFLSCMGLVPSVVKGFLHYNNSFSFAIRYLQSRDCGKPSNRVTVANLEKQIIL